MAGLEDAALGTIETAVGYGLGIAIGNALAPAGTEIAQAAYLKAPVKAPEAFAMALGVAQGQVAEGQAREWAAQQGYDGVAWQAMVDAANVGPAVGEAFEAWRRGLLSDGQFRTALNRTGLEPEWFTALEGLKDRLLDPSALATAIHRGIVEGHGLIVTEPPSGPGVVPRVPPSNLDPVAEAAGVGYTAERLRILVGNTGLPLSLGEMLQLLNRGEVTETDVQRSVAQSNVRNEYMDVALQLRRRLLTPHEYAELRLRGWISTAERDAGAALSGMEPADTGRLEQMLGRPLPVHQIVTGLERGGSFGGDYEGVPSPYLEALRESNVRPEWGNLAFHNRYTLPGAFVIRRLLQDGAITGQEGEQLFREEGWPPELAAKAAASYATGSGTTADPHVTKAETQLWTTIHRSYVASESGDGEATGALEALGVAPDARPKVLALWQHEREIVRRSLTPSQIRKAYAESKFSRDEALTRLEQLGLSVADANTLLDE